MNSPFLINFKDCILLMNLPFVIYILHELYVQKKKVLSHDFYSTTICGKING